MQSESIKQSLDIPGSKLIFFFFFEILKTTLYFSIRLVIISIESNINIHVCLDLTGYEAYDMEG